MHFDELAHLLFSKLRDRLQQNSVEVFVSNRARFEGWLKVEVAGILAGRGCRVIPEKDTIDITVDGWALELKTCATNYGYPGVADKEARDITRSIDGIISDAKSLQEKDRVNGAVLFVAFPLEHKNRKWQKHLSKILANVRKITHLQIQTPGGIPMVLYMALVHDSPSRNA